MRKYLLILFYLSLFPFFFIMCNSDFELDRKNQKEYLRMDLQRRVAEKVQNKHKLRASGFGFMGPDSYEILKISFEHAGVLSRDEARFLILDIAAIFLEEVNRDEKIRQHLCLYPYTVENLSIPIFPKKNGYEKPFHPDYVLIKLFKGVISFKTDVENQKYDYYTEEDETFEEALKILKEQGRVPDYFKED